MTDKEKIKSEVLNKFMMRIYVDNVPNQDKINNRITKAFEKVITLTQEKMQKLFEEKIKKLDLTITGIDEGDFNWQDVKEEIIKSFSNVQTKEDLLREIGRIVKSSGIKQELLNSIQNQQKSNLETPNKKQN